MEINSSRNLEDIINLTEEKLIELREILNISLKIKDEAEKNGENAAENIDALADLRGISIEKIKSLDLKLKRYNAELCRQNIEQEVKQEEDDEQTRSLRKITANIKIVLCEIKSADEINSHKIKLLISELKTKIKSVNDNRALMSKFTDDGGGDIRAGSLFNEKK